MSSVTGSPLADMAFDLVQMTAENETLREKVRRLERENNRLRTNSEEREIGTLSNYASKIEILANDCTKFRQEIRRMRSEKSRNRATIHKVKFEFLVFKQRFGVLRDESFKTINEMNNMLMSLKRAMDRFGTMLKNEQNNIGTNKKEMRYGEITSSSSSISISDIEELLNVQSKKLYNAIAKRQDRIVRGHIIEIERGVVHIMNTVDTFVFGYNNEIV